MRFLLYNIRYGAGAGHRFHLPLPFMGYIKRTSRNLNRISRFIESMQPDVIGLLEVDSGSYRSKRKNQANTVAERLRHTPVFQNKYKDGSMIRKVPLLNMQGNALLTNRSIRSQRFHYLNNGIKRLVIELELADVSIFLVHLSLKYRHRQYQLRDLFDLIRGAAKPVIVAGDFNAFWGDQELELFMAATGLKSANGNGHPSHPSRAPSRQLDYILHSPTIRPLGFQAPLIRLSDHIPLICDFDVPVVSSSQDQSQPAAA